MVLDASAIIAIVKSEPDRDLISAALFRAARVHMSPVNRFEAGVVAERSGKDGQRRLDEVLADAKVQIVPVDTEQMALASEGWRRFGKGRHRAGLNLGDCFAYALAKSLDEPLLFKGDDFRHTDVRPAISSKAHGFRTGTCDPSAPKELMSARRSGWGW